MKIKRNGKKCFPIKKSNRQMNSLFVILFSVPFIINSTTGEVYTTESLDREYISEYSFKVIARDLGYPVMTSEVNVKVILLDINDHVPVFDRPQYWANLIERSPIGSVVMLPRATDWDIGENANMTFTLQSATGADRYFDIDSRNGLIQVSEIMHLSQLRQDGILDPETSDTTLTLTLYATDHGEPEKRGESTVYIHLEQFRSAGLLAFDNYTYYQLVEEGQEAGICNSLYY